MNEHVNWFPKHMKDSEEILKKNLTAVDMVFEVLDARAPLSSKDLNIHKLIGQKSKIIILNKCDLASDEGNKAWVSFFKEKGIYVILVSAIKGDGIKTVISSARRIIDSRFSEEQKRSSRDRFIRAMVVGIPNVGKSTMINYMAGKKKAKAANKPGVTRTKEWIKTNSQLELLDTPGTLRPRKDSETVLNLAFIGTIKDQVMDVPTLAFNLIERLVKIIPENVEERYKIEVKDKTPLEILDAIAAKRGCVMKNNIVDYNRVAGIVLGEFRKGILGKITLEHPPAQ